MRAALILLLAAAVTAADVGDRIDAALRAVPRGARAAVAVFDCRANTWIYARNAQVPMRTASTAKLFTSAAALAELGRDYRFRTRLVQIGKRQGTAIAGLGIIGGGDPCLDEHFAEGRDPDAFFARWSATIAAMGIRRIDGDIVVDNRLFSGPIRPATYPADHTNQQSWFSAPASAFAWADNCIEVRVLPREPGLAAEVQVRPQSSRIGVSNATRSASSGKTTFIVNRAAESNDLEVSGTYADPTAWFALAIHSEPDLLAAEHLAAHLRRAGIEVAGTVRIGPVDPAGAPLIEEVHALVPALAVLNKRSQNFYGEQILRLIGAQRLGEGSIAAGVRAVQASLRRMIGEDAAQVELLDGCGLSYGNTATPGAMVRMLAVMERSPLGGDYLATLLNTEDDKVKDKYEVAGRTGRIKTGTLNVAVTLAGYIDGPSGARHAFAIMLDRGEGAGIDWAYGMRGKLYRIIAESVP